MLFDQVNRGGLTLPSELSFLSCVQSWQLYQTISKDCHLESLLRSSNVISRKVFEEVLTKNLNSCEETQLLFLLKRCDNGHFFSTFLKNFAQKTFNLFSSNYVNVQNSKIHSCKTKKTDDKKRNPIKHKVAKLTSSSII